MIVKVQASITTSRGRRRVLAYSQDKSVLVEREMLDEIAERLGKRHKVFFEAEVVDGNLELGDEVPDPGW